MSKTEILKPKYMNAYDRIKDKQQCYVCKKWFKPKTKMRIWSASLEGTRITIAFVCKPCYHNTPKQLIEQNFKRDTETVIKQRAES